MRRVPDKSSSRTAATTGRAFKAEGGFTLIELLLVIAITGIIGAAVFNTYFNSWQSWVISSDKINLQQAHRTVMSRITPLIREAEMIKISPDGEQLMIRFAAKDTTGLPYNLLKMGAAGQRFYLQKGYTDGVNFNWYEPLLIAGSEKISIIEPSFAYQEQNRIIIIKLKLRPAGSGRIQLDDYRFRDSIFLRNEDITVDF